MVGGRDLWLEFQLVGVSGFPCTVRILILGNGDQGAPFGALEYGVER